MKQEEGAGAAKQPGPNTQHKTEHSHATTVLGIHAWRIMRYAAAAALVAIAAAFGTRLADHWRFLADIDQTMGVLACLVLGACAIAIVARRRS